MKHCYLQFDILKKYGKQDYLIQLEDYPPISVHIKDGAEEDE